jgi:hypothetical protein
MARLERIGGLVDRARRHCAAAGAAKVEAVRVQEMYHADRVLTELRALVTAAKVESNAR